MKKFIKNAYSKVSPSYRRMTYIMNLVKNLKQDNITLRQENLDIQTKLDEIRDISLRLENLDIQTKLDEIRDISLRLESNINTAVQQQESTRELIKTTINIENMPKATGVLRDIQMISLGMLKEVERICKKHKLEYWLDFGTLLGAVRHKGFIPWDDDMDISMMSDSYEKFVAVVDEELADTNYRFIKVPSQIGKMVHKDFMPHGKDETTKFIHWELKGKLSFALDIFPYYYAKNSLSYDELSKYLISACSDKTGIFDGEHVYSDFKKAAKEVKKYISILKSDTVTDVVFLGPETRAYQPRITGVKDLFPLGIVEFEGLQFPSPANPKPYLVDYYGDYMQLPGYVHTHLFIDTIPRDDLKLLKRVRQKEADYSV
jgi:lipopolysaccharide cholinephosphotransferase